VLRAKWRSTSTTPGDEVENQAAHVGLEVVVASSTEELRNSPRPDAIEIREVGFQDGDRL
jgi:hypothetical protein